MSPTSAALTTTGPGPGTRLVVEDGWKPSEAAKLFMVSTVTRTQVGAAVARRRA